jgi:AraC-like DNA-binding protein
LEKLKRTFHLDTAQKKSVRFDSENFEEASFYHYRTNLGLSYMFFNSSFEKDIIMESKHEANDVSFMLFNYSRHDSELQDFHMKNRYIFKSGHCAIGKICENFQSLNTYAAHHHYHMHYILFGNDIFQDLVKEDLNQKPRFEVEGFKINQEMPIDVKQKLILDELPTLFSLKGKLQELYLESKIIDLIYITINLIKTVGSDKNHELKSKDIECVYKAKEILINNISNPPSLKMLASQSAINEFKLKKGFKQLFGKTVFSFLQEYRLNEAKKILTENEININEVCDIVGYKSVSHFSKIFKDYYGVNPIEIRKNQKRVYL